MVIKNKDETTKLLNVLKSDMENQIKQVCSGWVNAFMNLKGTVKTVVGDLRTSIDDIEAKKVHQL